MSLCDQTFMNIMVLCDHDITILFFVFLTFWLWVSLFCDVTKAPAPLWHFQLSPYWIKHDISNLFSHRLLFTQINLNDNIWSFNEAVSIILQIFFTNIFLVGPSKQKWHSLESRKRSQVKRWAPLWVSSASLPRWSHVLLNVCFLSSAGDCPGFRTTHWAPLMRCWQGRPAF